MTEVLGSAVLELDARTTKLEHGLNVANRSADQTQRHLDALATVAKLAEHALQDIRMTAGQTAESRASIAGILDGVRGLSPEAHAAAAALEDVRMTERQAAETAAAGERMDGTLDKVTRKANEARRALLSVRLAGGRNGTGIGPFGSGFGRIGVLGTALSAGVLAAPALAPAALGGLAAIPTLAAGGVGALGTLALAFAGVGKAIGGDKKAFDELTASQQAFVLKIRSLDGFLDRLKQTAASSLFPGLTKGLKAALSPGTLGAVSKAVQEFGTAIGNAGAEWGRYFGSSQFQRIFGPLMQAGARGFSVMSHAALSLFDAFGVLGRAAIPFTNWLEDSAAKGARWVDSFIRAKNASGGLAHALTEAQTSLRLVGGLVASLWRAVYALGKALYPVSKVAIKDLTNGLNGLAGIIDHNRGAIRGLIGTALTGLVTIVKGASTVVGGLAGAFQQLPGVVKVAAGAAALALTVALGPDAAAIGATLFAVGVITKKWTEFKDFFSGLWKALKGIVDLGVYGMLASFGTLLKGLAGILSHIPIIGGKVSKGLNAAVDFITDFKRKGLAAIKEGGSLAGSAFDVALNGAGQNGFPGLSGNIATAVGHAIDNAARKKSNALVKAAPDTTNPFGSNPPFTKNLGPKSAAAGTMPGYTSLLSSLDKFSVRIPALVALNIAAYKHLFGIPKQLSGSTSFHLTGDNLLTTATRLAIDRAKMTRSPLDDLKVYRAAIGELRKMAKTAHDFNRVPIADEMAKLAGVVQRLTGNMDGFNLTVAEHNRHSLDARYADKYHARAREHMTGTPGPAINYAPTFVSPDEKESKRAAARDWWRFRQTVLAG